MNKKKYSVLLNKSGRKKKNEFEVELQRKKIKE